MPSTRYPGLQVAPLRGSVEARLAALQRGDLDATVLAISGEFHCKHTQNARAVVVMTACKSACALVDRHRRLLVIWRDVHLREHRSEAAAQGAAGHSGARGGRHAACRLPGRHWGGVPRG